MVFTCWRHASSPFITQKSVIGKGPHEVIKISFIMRNWKTDFSNLYNLLVVSLYSQLSRISCALTAPSMIWFTSHLSFKYYHLYSILQVTFWRSYFLIIAFTNNCLRSFSVLTCIKSEASTVNLHSCCLYILEWTRLISFRLIFHFLIPFIKHFWYAWMVTEASKPFAKKYQWSEMPVLANHLSTM